MHMKKRHLMGTLLAGVMTVSLLAGCGSQAPGTEDVLMIAKQGMFSSGGTVTEPVEGEYDPTTNWLDDNSRWT